MENNFSLDDLNELENLKKMLEDLNSNFGIEQDPNREKEVEELMKGYNYIQNDFKFITKYINNSNNIDPEYNKEGDSGFDIRAFLDAPVTLKSLERKLIPTGLQFELPSNTELQIRPRSGMALKHGISVLNTPGTVDEGYRGDVGIIVVNLSNNEYTIEPGDRIAQGVVMSVVGQKISKLSKTKKLNETERGSDGFGSTGKK